jgi:hypothetical protein
MVVEWGQTDTGRAAWREAVGIRVRRVCASGTHRAQQFSMAAVAWVYGWDAMQGTHGEERREGVASRLLWGGGRGDLLSGSDISVRYTSLRYCVCCWCFAGCRWQPSAACALHRRGRPTVRASLSYGWHGVVPPVRTPVLCMLRCVGGRCPSGGLSIKSINAAPCKCLHEFQLLPLDLISVGYIVWQ